MSACNDWMAIAFSGSVGNEIEVSGEAKAGTLNVMPELEKPIHGINPKIILLDLL